MLKLAALLALLSASLVAQMGPAPSPSSPQQFVGGCVSASPCSYLDVLALNPCSTANVGQYAVVNDLYSGAASTNEVMRCSASGSLFYWRPVRTDYAVTVSSTGGTMTLACLANAPTMFVAGSLLSNITIGTPATTNCWPGAQFTVKNGATLGIFSVNIFGILITLNGVTTIVFDGTSQTWKQL